MLWHINKRELVDSDPTATVGLDWIPLNSLTFWTCSLVLSVFSWALGAHFYGFQMMRVGLHVRVGCSYLIYRKSLKLGPQRLMTKAARKSEGKTGVSEPASTMGKMVSSRSPSPLDCHSILPLSLPRTLLIISRRAWTRLGHTIINVE